MIRSRISLAENARRGMVMVQIALSLSVLMGMLALLVDGGLALVERRHAQATADAAALAAASDIYTGSAGTASASATNVALGQRLHRHDFDRYGQQPASEW